VTASGVLLGSNNPLAVSSDGWDVSASTDTGGSELPKMLRIYVPGSISRGGSSRANEIANFSEVEATANIPIAFCAGTLNQASGTWFNSFYGANYQAFPLPSIFGLYNCNIFLARFRGTTNPDTDGYWQLVFVFKGTPGGYVTDMTYFSQSIWKKIQTDATDDSPLGNYTKVSSVNLGSFGMDTISGVSIDWAA
jgi:hypothetical protein